jgi:hypothetical protein
MNVQSSVLRAAIALIFSGAAGFAVAQTVPAIVGEATMVIGVARIVGADGSSRSLDRGAPIRVGDRVETEAGGHAHFRFVDGGRLSIRPSSRLHVESYNHSAQQPAGTAIKFRLDEGVVRSITGAWGEAARDKFRLNTPVAAIGVKGTDFVVRSEADKTTASVYTGAIVLSSLAGCTATLGPCANGSEKLLSEEMKGQMLELSRQQAIPQLVPLVDLLAQKGLLPATEQASRSDKPVAANGVRPELASDKPLVTQVRSAEVVAAGSAVAPAPSVVVVVPAVMPPVVENLVWGRWGGAPDGDTISVAFEEAVKNGRMGTVGNGAFGLYRPAADSQALLKTTDASANFRLAGSAAQFFYAQGRQTVSEAARVDGGTLNVDFSKATFATQLNVSSPTMGKDSLQANGIIKPNGYMFGQDGNAYVAGALTLDGKEAGYFFERALSSGNLSGITLWGR